MQAVAELTVPGHARRLHLLARTALAAYDLTPRRISLVANHLNAIFRVDTVAGQCYALRISHPSWRTLDDLRSELAWLVALARDTDISAPVPVATRTGDLIATVQVPGVAEPRRCALCTWLPGVLLIYRLLPANMVKLGELAARLHIHGSRFVLGPEFPRRYLDRIFARGEEDVLFGPGGAPFLTPAIRAVFDRVRARVDDAFAHRYADPAGLAIIHHDLQPDNVKLYQGRLFPIDFEDAIWGHPVQDIAMTFNELLFYTPGAQAEYVALRQAFEEGYRTRAPWPEAYPGEIDSFIAGRQLWRANYVARFEAPHAAQFNAWLAPRFETFLTTGAFAKQSL